MKRVRKVKWEQEVNKNGDGVVPKEPLSPACARGSN